MKEDWTLILPVLERIVDALQAEPGTQFRAAIVHRLQRSLAYLGSVSADVPGDEVYSRLDDILHAP